MEMVGKKQQPAPLLVLLAILLITTLEMVPEVVGAGAGPGNKQVCDFQVPECGGKCMSCCKYYNLNPGHCSLRGLVCYCCHGPNSGAGQQQQQWLHKVIQRSRMIDPRQGFDP